MLEFTLVSTVFNEAKRLDQTISDLEAQTLLPTEIIITDAGSTDGTYQRLQDWKKRSRLNIKLLQKEKCNVAEGRNLAVRHAKTDIIVSTDFGCRFRTGWLQSLITPFNQEDVKVVGGAFSVDEKEQTSLASKAAYMLSRGYDIDVHSDGFIPSSRSIAYKKEVFDKIGGYCEWLTLAADDLVFGKEILANGYKYTIAEEANVLWLRHSTAKAFAKEGFRYGLGDGESHMNISKAKDLGFKLALRAIFILTILTLTFLQSFHIQGYHLIILPILLISLNGFRPYASIIKLWLKFKSAKYNFKVLIFSFYLYEYIKYNYLKGYVRGYFYSSSLQKEGCLRLQHRLNIQ
jgi:glycosyltransferase involved in cell wall biosynthesis